MARIPVPFATIVAALSFAAAGVLLGISATQPDPGTEAAHASQCDSRHQADPSAFCWVDKAATVADAGTGDVVIQYGISNEGRSTGSRAEIGWVSLVIPPQTGSGPEIPLSLADWNTMHPRKGDQVTARIAQGLVASIASPRGRFRVMDGSPVSYQLVFPALFFLGVGLITAGFSRDRRLRGGRRTLVRVADRVFLPLTVVAVVVFYIHRGPATLWGLMAAGAATAAGYFAAVQLTLPTVPTRTAPRPRP